MCLACAGTRWVPPGRRMGRCWRPHAPSQPARHGFGGSRRSAARQGERGTGLQTARASTVFVLCSGNSCRYSRTRQLCGIFGESPSRPVGFRFCFSFRRPAPFCISFVPGRGVKRGWEPDPGAPAAPGACPRRSSLCRRQHPPVPGPQHHPSIPRARRQLADARPRPGHPEGTALPGGRGRPLPGGCPRPSLGRPGARLPTAAPRRISWVKPLMLPLRGRLLSVSGSL